MAYCAQERVNAKKLAWPILHDLSDEYEWRVHFNNVELVATFETDSTIELFGLDDPRRARLFRGRQFDEVIVDEAQDFCWTNLQHFTQRVAIPTLADRNGRLFMAGTPGDRAEGVPPCEPGDMHYFYEVAWLRKHPQWTVVHGEFLENPWTAAQLSKQIEMYRRANPNVDQEPWFQREYLGKWVIDTRSVVIRLRPDLNYLYEWQPHEDDQYVLGIDFGWKDPSAYVLAVWNPRLHNWTIYLEAFVARGMYLHDHIAKLREYQTRYPRIRMVADPAGHAAALHAELRDIHGFPLEDADKREKMFALERLNSEASLAAIKVFNLADAKWDGTTWKSDTPELNPVAQQWATLCWEIDSHGQRVEGTPRHVSDGAVYARRACAPWLHTPKPDPESAAELQRRKMRAQRFATVRRSVGMRH